MVNIWYTIGWPPGVEIWKRILKFYFDSSRIPWKGLEFSEHLYLSQKIWLWVMTNKKISCKQSLHCFLITTQNFNFFHLYQFHFKMGSTGFKIKEKICTKCFKTIKSYSFWWKVRLTLGPGISGTKCDRGKMGFFILQNEINKIKLSIK